MKALIIGWPRSGTSLTLRIFKGHPQVEQTFFETKLLRKQPIKKRLVNLYKPFGKGRNCAEKIIYEGPKFGSKTKDTPQMYAERWNTFFGNEAKIIQIIRHPKDVWNSLLLKLYIKRHWEHLILIKLEQYFDSFVTTLNDIEQHENCLTIKYEDLILNSNKMINNIYKFCELEAFDYSEKMKIKKAFLHKEIGMRIDTDERLVKYRKKFNKIFYDRLPEMIDKLNQFPGVKYEKERNKESNY